MENNSNNMVHNSSNLMEEVNISQEAKEVVKNFVELGIKKLETNDYEVFGEDAPLLLEDSMLDSLFVSLYSMQPYAKQEVLEVLKTDIVNLSEYLSAEEIEILQNELRKVMRYCFSAKNKHTFGIIYIDGFFPMPTSLFELCTKMASPTPDSNILLPYSYPEMFVFFSNEYNFDGYASSEWGIEEWGFSQIMADVFGVKAMIKNNRISEVSNNARKQYDYIFAYPPIFGGIWFYSDLVLLINDFLKDNGKMFCLLPYEFLFAPIWENSRKMLVDSSLEIKVIKLPKHVNFSFIHNESCLLYIKKMHTDNFTLIDATNFQSMDCSHHVTTLPKSEAELLLETIEKNKEKIVWQGTATDLTEDNDFRPEIYLMEKELPIPHKGDELMALSELVEILECVNKEGDADRDSSYIEVRPLDFMSDYLHSGIDPEKMSVRTEDAKRLLTSDSLLFSVEGRVSRFSYSSRIVALDKRIIPFRLKAHDVIMEDFLLRALTLVETLKQVRAYMRYGGELSERDFLRIKIIVPAVERQKELCMEDSGHLRKPVF